jgi:hypothetical protein
MKKKRTKKKVNIKIFKKILIHFSLVNISDQSNIKNSEPLLSTPSIKDANEQRKMILFLIKIYRK